MKWIVKDIKEEDDIGFVYKITNKLNNKFYIGKKQLYKQIRRKPLKGYKRVRISRVESDWRIYQGSCKSLLEDIKLYGENNFEKEIIKYCKSKWELTYMELKYQLEYDVLNPKVNSYNGIINIRLRKLGDKDARV